MFTGQSIRYKESLTVLITIFLLAACNKQDGVIKYTTGEWDEDTLGYHRIVIECYTDADAVFVEVPWRRRDREPWNKAVIITAGEGQDVITNKKCLSSDNEKGRFVFQPVNGAGKYFMYHLPGKMEGRSNYPTVNYPAPEQTADNAWLEIHRLNDSASVASLPAARVTAIQSRNEFNSFWPMEVIATEDEIRDLLDDNPDKTYLVFPEDRSHSIRMNDYLPLRWVREGPSGIVEGKALRGEFFTFQLGLYCIREGIEDIDISFSGLSAGRNRLIIPPDSIHSFNTGGTGWNGQPFRKKVTVAEGMVQPLWFGFLIPENTDAGKIKGHIIIKPAGHKPETLKIRISISDRLIHNHGDDDPEMMTRLRWLNSKMALDNEITYPFMPLEKKDRSLKITGRQVDIGSGGLPSRYISWFNPSNTALEEKGENILASPMTLSIYRANGSKIYFVNEEPVFERNGPGQYRWQTVSRSAALEMRTEGTLEFDGFSSLRISIKANTEIDLSDIRLSMQLRKKFAEYIMGLGMRGGERPYYLNWKWNRMKHQEGAWIGGVNGGIQFALRDDNYERPLNTNFYREKPLVMPESWYNEGKGGINISSGNNTAMVNCYSGSRIMKEGDELVFRVNLLFTPFKLLDTDSQWNTRFWHRYGNLDSIQARGANVVNVHHATEINPWINYPFLEQEKMKDYIDKAHDRNMKVKIYNTIRELSNRAPELFALRSLGHEIISPGPGKGFNWLQEHLVDDYIAAWFVPEYKDAAIINSGMSRWHNYYVEGINWLSNNMGIDGLYLDDIAFDRTTMKRVRKVLDRNRDDAIIDLHSANQYNVRDGYTNSANLYMEHFPYVDRLWFGEYFDPGLPPASWLVEMSGIPFGIMGEMLQDGGNQYRGLLYGMTSRAPWSGDPSNIWELFDEFDITGSVFKGYWSDDCPVSTGYRQAPATVYLKEKRMMVAIASWYDEHKELWLNIDWNRAGIDKNKAVISAPFISDFQEEQSFSLWDRIPVDPGKGIVLIIEEKEQNSRAG